MTPQEYKHLRQRVLCISQADLADKLGSTRWTIIRREAQQGAIEPEASFALQHLVALKLRDAEND